MYVNYSRKMRGKVMAKKQPSNMPEFKQMQYEFAAWIRKPDLTNTPQNIELRRMKIYRELFLNNVAGFLENAFPVAKETIGLDTWQPLVEQFFAEHLSTTPYFREIPEEFMAWLTETPTVLGTLPPWFAELLHYEWLDLYVGTLDAETPEANPNGDVLAEPIVLSPFFDMAAYRFPVHTISPSNKPSTAPDTPTLLAIYRTPDHKIRFMEMEPLSAMLLETLRQNKGITGNKAAELAAQTASQPYSPKITKQILAAFKQRYIILGTSK